MSSGCSGPFGGWHQDQLLAAPDLAYYEVEPVKTRPRITMAGLLTGVVVGLPIGYMLHMAVHGG